MVNNLCEESNALFVLYCRCIAISTVVETGVAMILTLLVLHPQGMGTLYTRTCMLKDLFDANVKYAKLSKFSFSFLLGRER